MQKYYNILIITFLCCLWATKAEAGILYSRPNAMPYSSSFSQLWLDDDDDDKPKKKDKKKDKSKKSNNKKVTFETFEQNYERAKELYNKQSYLSAARIYEELYPLSLGTPLADTILFLFADCYYKNGDYELAAFHFKEYANRYTSSPRAEEAYFSAIRAISMLSPEYSLDQTETYYVIEEVEQFIQRYPNSAYMPDCNRLLDQMRNKLARKAFEVIKLYYATENYQAVQILARNFFKTYSYSQYADDVYLVLVKNNFDYAQRSVEAKKQERYAACVEAYTTMQINCSTSPLLASAKKVADEAQNKLNKKENPSKKKNRKNEDRFKKE